MNNRQTQDFARYEFKYLLNKEYRQNIEDAVSQFMEYDGHVHVELGNSYIVRSLYFDNNTSSNFFEKVDGMRTRSKFRLRTYGKEYESNLPLYLEKKGRTLERTYKRRIPISYDDLHLFMNLESVFELIKKYKNIDLISNFVYESVRKGIRPKVLVDYRRRPYTSAFDSNFRVTFDDSLMASKAEDPYIFVGDVPWIHFNSGYAILEVKFFRKIPPWFHRIIQAYNLRRLSISKFARGMEACGYATDTGE